MTARIALLSLVSLVGTAVADPRPAAKPALGLDAALAVAPPAPGRPQDEQVLVSLIADTPDSSDDKPDLYFRLAAFYSARYFAARGGPDTTKTKTELLRAVKTYVALVGNNAFQHYARLDRALFDYGRLLVAARYMKEARAVFDKLVKTHPDSPHVPEAHVVFGDYFFEVDQLADAEARYRVVLKSPKSGVYWYAMYRLGWVHLALTRYQDALDTFLQVAQGTRTDAARADLNREAKRDFVRAFAEIGRVDRAYATFQRVDASDARDMLVLLGELYAARGEDDKAAQVERELDRVDPQRAAAAALATLPDDVELAVPPKRPPVAEPLTADELALVDELARDLDKRPDRVRARLIAAGIFRKRGHHDEAIALVTGLVARDHDDPLVELACDLWLDSLVRMRRFDRALEVADTLRADKHFLEDKPQLARNIAFLRSRSLR